MPTLFNRAPKDSYQELLKLTNTGAGLDTTLRTVEDGVGAVSPLSLSTTQIALNGLVWPAGVPGTGQVLTVGTGNQLSWANPSSGGGVQVATYNGVLAMANATLTSVSVQTTIQEITLCNTGLTDASFTLYIVSNSDSPSSSNAIFYNAQILAGQTVVINTDMVIPAGGSLQGSANSSSVTIRVSSMTGDNLDNWYQDQMPTTNSVVYTVPTGGTQTISSMLICNTTGTPQTYSISYSGTVAANSFMTNISVPVGTTVLADLATVLPAGTTISAVSSSPALTLTINGF